MFCLGVFLSACASKQAPAGDAVRAADLVDIATGTGTNTAPGEAPAVRHDARLQCEHCPTLGPDSALITIIEFGDFQCPYCRRVEPTISRLRETFPDDVQIVFRNLPLSFHMHARPAQIAALAAHQQGAFWEFKALAMSDEALLAAGDYGMWAAHLGLDTAAFNHALVSQSQRLNAVIEEDTAHAESFGIRGTPHFLINGRRVRGAQPYEHFEQIVREELAKIERSAAIVGVSPDRVVALEEDRNLSTLYAELEATEREAQRPAPVEPEGPYDIPIRTEDPQYGPVDAPVHLVIYSEFQCPYCVRFLTTVDDVAALFPDQLHIVLKSFPLDFHSDARRAATAGLAANAQDRFWPFARLMLGDSSSLSRRQLDDYADSLGLDMDAFGEALDTDAFADHIDRDIAEGVSFGVSGTPTWFVNGVRYQGALPAAELEAAIREALGAAAP